MMAAVRISHLTKMPFMHFLRSLFLLRILQIGLGVTIA